MDKSAMDAHSQAVDAHSRAVDISSRAVDIYTWNPKEKLKT